MSFQAVTVLVSMARDLIDGQTDYLHMTESTAFRGPLVVCVGRYTGRARASETLAIGYLKKVERIMSGLAVGSYLWRMKEVALLEACEVPRREGLYLIADSHVRMSCAKSSQPVSSSSVVAARLLRASP